MKIPIIHTIIINIVLVCASYIVSTTPCFGQVFHPQEPISLHYKELQQYSSLPQNRSALDTLKFPLHEANETGLTYTLCQTYYLSKQQVNTLKEAVTYPSNSSVQTRAELDYLLKLQAQRTPEQEKRVLLLADIGYLPHLNLLTNHPQHNDQLKDLFFEGRTILGYWCSVENFPRLGLLLKNAMLDMRVIEFSVKYTHLRPRPYHLEPRLQPMARMQSPSFASGHTLWAFLQAYLWSEIVPTKRAAFLELAEEIRQSREIMGIHYPSDNETARILSYKMITLFMKNKKFAQDLRNAKTEWQAKSLVLQK